MEKIIVLRNTSVNVQFLGRDPEAGTVLVFLHEALGSIIQWKDFPAKLCEETGMPGIVIERSGHGKSGNLAGERKADYLHGYTHETKQVLDELLPLNTKVILIGHSDGGTIALLYAKLYPKGLSGICTMAAHTFVEPETLAGITPAVQAYQNGKLDGLKRIHGEKANTLFFAWADTWRASFFLDWDIRTEIKGITCPVLALQGSNDQYGTEAQVDSIAAAASNCETYIIPGCGHHPHIEKQEEVLSKMGNWISLV